MDTDISSLLARVKELEDQIALAAKAPTEMEKGAVLEIALAKIERRKPKQWATEYMSYVTTASSSYYF